MRVELSYVHVMELYQSRERSASFGSFYWTGILPKAGIGILSPCPFLTCTKVLTVPPTGSHIEYHLSEQSQSTRLS